tara:strand:+ start:1979 stop:2944 length:966 start_codon:yes stop_codon:yes gene_type:complete
MLKTANTIENDEKFLCYCAKVTNKTFVQILNQNNHNNLEKICNHLELAKQCSACLPKIEDKYYQLKGRRQIVSNLSSQDVKYKIKDKIKIFLDSILGDTFYELHGYLPMLNSKIIKTWLVLSNDNPSIIENKTVPFKLKFIIFNDSGIQVKKFEKIINPSQNYKVCLSDFVSSSCNKLKTYYVKVTRAAIEKGFRGSTRTHFFYEAKKSMATLHTQYGSQKINYIKYITSKNGGKNFIFIINPHNKKACIQSSVKSLSNQKMDIVTKNHFTIPSRGSILYDLSKINTNCTEHFFECHSFTPIKCYFIITDKHLENFSVDHI